MESFSGDTEESTEDVPGRKKSKLKSLRTRIFGRRKAGEEEDTKLSQSASDITAGKGLGSDEDLTSSQGMMGSRAVSHDSIFLADQDLTDAEPSRVLSQENVHSKIKALQIKLQQQKMHLGPPPLVLPVRRPEDDGAPHSPPEISEALSKTTSQPSFHPFSPTPKPAPTRSVTQTPSLPLLLSVSSNSNSSAVEPPLDFSSPAQFTPCLDTSAARHRMSVKPRNQRASTKKTLPTNDHKSDILNNIHHPEPEREEQQQFSTQEDVTLDTEQGGDDIHTTAQYLPSKCPEVAPITSEAASVQSSSLEVSQPDQASHGSVSSAPSQILRVKPHRPAERPHSSFIQSEVKDSREGDSETQVLSHDKRNTVNKAGMTEVSSSNPKSSSVQQALGTESTRGIKRPTPGSGSFHFSITSAKNWDAERPRSGSFVEVLEHTEARHKTATEDKPFSSMRDKEELRGGPIVVGRLRQDGASLQSSAPWDRRDSLKKVESVTPCKNVTTDRGAAEVESNQEAVEEAVEAQEVEDDDGKTAFGVKLRSTTRFRRDSSSKPQECVEQCDKVKTQEVKDVRPTDSIPSGFSLPVKQNSPPTGNPQIMASEVHTTSSNLTEVETAVAAPREPEPASQTASSEVSWMSLAMEKTRSLQQLFSSRFPRDFTAVQTAARPQAQVLTDTPAGEQPVPTQTVKIQQSTTPLEANQPSSDAVKAEAVHSRGQAQTSKPSPMTVQQKASNTSREPQTVKVTSEPQSVSHPAVQTNPCSTQSPLHSSAPTETPSQCAQGSGTQSLAHFYLSSAQQQPPRSQRGPQPTNQLKPTTSVSTTSSASAPPAASALGRGEREAAVQETEGASLSGRRAVWAGSVSERAAFLERRAEWTSPPGTKGMISQVELKKAPSEVQTSDESPASVKTTTLTKDIKPEGRQGVKLAESSPTKIPERPREDRWLRKTVASSSSRSLSPIMPSVLQSDVSDSGQPSWMELAKRKSMAWSDKSMD